jgi:hypothetical protein
MAGEESVDLFGGEATSASVGQAAVDAGKVGLRCDEFASDGRGLRFGRAC